MVSNSIQLSSARSGEMGHWVDRNLLRRGEGRSVAMTVATVLLMINVLIKDGLHLN